MQYTYKTIQEFIVESNWIEDERTEEAHIDSFTAWGYLITQSELTLENILEAHGILMTRLDPDIAGKFRRVNVRVGTASTPRVKEVYKRMEKWLNNPDPETEEEIKENHIAFELVHPFQDGNGRVGRLILNWYRVKNNLPILVIKESEKLEYYKLFK